MTALILALVAGAVIGLALGGLGGGGSVLAVPALIYLLGFTTAEATTASLVIVTLTSVTALTGHARDGNVAWRTGLLFAAAGIVPAMAAGAAAGHLPQALLTIAFSVIAALAALRMLRPARTGPTGPVSAGRAGAAGAGLGAGPGHRLLVAQIAERGDRHHDGVAPYDVPAHHGGARDLALVAQPVHHLGRPADREFGRHHEAQQQGGRYGAHRGDVREVLRGRLAPHVVGRGPVAAKVPSLQQDVGARHHPPVRRGHHCGVVTRADTDRRSGGETGGELPDEPEFPELTNRALHVPDSPSLPSPDRADSRLISVPDTVEMTPTRSGTTADTVPDDRQLPSCLHPGAQARFPQVSPRGAATRYRGVPFPHMILVAALEVPWYRRTS